MTDGGDASDEAGTIPFSGFMDGALYGDGGFYETGGRAGRRGDFVTSPEVGPLFGAVLARALDAWWDDLGRPDPFLVDEHGAGPGTLARTVLVAAPRCAPALRLTLVERTAAQRSLHADHLPHVAEPDTDPRWLAPETGPIVTSVGAPPTRPAHVVVANELLDNLPVDRFERTATGWAELRVTPTTLGVGGNLSSSGGDDRVAEVAVTATADDAARLDALAPDAAVGARVPLQRSAAAWVADRLAGLAPGGHLVVVDYGVTATAELAARPEAEWLRTYTGQGRSGPPLDDPGSRDITLEVALDQLAEVAGPPDVDVVQAEWLRRWGIDDLVAEGRASWEAGGPPLDVATLRLRSRVGEAEALLDPTGLGAFRVWEWHARR